MSAQRRRRKRSATDNRRREPGVLSLLLALFLAMVVGSLWGDATGYAYGYLGGLIWAVALLVSFAFGVIYFAQFVLPLPLREGWPEGIRMIWRYDTLKYEQFLQQTVTRHPRRRIAPSPHLPRSFIELRAGMVYSHQVLALTRGNSFSRAAGPGFVMLYGREYIKEVIDLRLHHRSQTVEATTRDGIPIKTNVSVLFRVQRHDPDHDDGNLQYPYDRETIFRVSYMRSIGAGDEDLSWTEQICPRAAALLVNALARYKLDDLYQIDNANAQPLTAIGNRLTQDLRRSMDDRGVEIVTASVSRLSLPDKVEEQRLRSWRAGWQRKIQEQRGSGEAEAMRRIKRARARAQIEIISNIIENIDTMRRAGDTNLTEIIMLRMIEALEDATGNEAVRSLLPEQIMRSLVHDAANQMNYWLSGPREDNGS